MKFKNKLAEMDYKVTPAFLRKVCEDFETFSLFYGVEPVVTRVREGVCGDSGVHEAGRAVDFRDACALPDGTVGRIYKFAQIKNIIEMLNQKYPREDGKPVALHHSFNGGPLHIHIQIPAAWLNPGEPKARPSDLS